MAAGTGLFFCVEFEGGSVLNLFSFFFRVGGSLIAANEPAVSSRGLPSPVKVYAAPCRCFSVLTFFCFFATVPTTA